MQYELARAIDGDGTDTECTHLVDGGGTDKEMALPGSGEPLSQTA